MLKCILSIVETPKLLDYLVIVVQLLDYLVIVVQLSTMLFHSCAHNKEKTKSGRQVSQLVPDPQKAMESEMQLEKQM